MIMSTVNDILRCPVFKFDKLSDNLCPENMHLHGSIIQGSRYTQIQTIRHKPRGLYYPGKSCDLHVTSFHFRVAKKRPMFNECVMF